MKSLSTVQKSIAKATGDIRGHVDQLRVEILALREERDWLKSGPLPPMEVVDLINSYVDDQADQFDIQAKIGGATLAGRDLRESLSALFATGGQLTNGYATNGIATGFVDSDIGPLLCHFFSDTIKATLAADIEGMDYQAGPPQAERRDLIETLTAKIYDLEVQEETLIEAAEESGITILRRIDCSAAIVLSFEVVETEALDPPKYEAAQVREI